MTSLFGFDFIEVKPKYAPKLKLSDSCPVSDSFREEFNQWLVDQFGMRDVSIVPKGTAYMIGNKMILRTEEIVKLTNFCC